MKHIIRYIIYIIYKKQLNELDHFLKSILPASQRYGIELQYCRNIWCEIMIYNRDNIKCVFSQSFPIKKLKDKNFYVKMEQNFKQYNVFTVK